MIYQATGNHTAQCYLLDSNGDMLAQGLSGDVPNIPLIVDGYTWTQVVCYYNQGESVTQLISVWTPPAPPPPQVVITEAKATVGTFVIRTGAPVGFAGSASGADGITCHGVIKDPSGTATGQGFDSGATWDVTLTIATPGSYTAQLKCIASGAKEASKTVNFTVQAPVCEVGRYDATRGACVGPMTLRSVDLNTSFIRHGSNATLIFFVQVTIDPRGDPSVTCTFTDGGGGKTVNVDGTTTYSWQSPAIEYGPGPHIYTYPAQLECMEWGHPSWTYGPFSVRVKV
jgi:hypothetical protein